MFQKIRERPAKTNNTFPRDILMCSLQLYVLQYIQNKGASCLVAACSCFLNEDKD